MMPFLAVVLPIIILFCGLSIDLARLELVEQQMQTAADAAALGAELEAERGTNNWHNQAALDAGINGFTNGVNGVTVTAVEGATFGAYNGRYDALQVSITQPMKTIFMGALNGGLVTARATGVALITPCTYLFGTGTLQNQALIVYTGSFLGNSCPVYVNGGMDIEANGHIAVEAINVAGSAASSNQAGFVYPTPQFNVNSMSDPLAWITPPSFSGTCNHTGYSLSGGTATLNPGTFCKGMSFTNSTVTLNPGLYVITGGGTWSNSTVTGNGVTLYFTEGGGASSGQFKIVNNSNVTLSAPNDNSAGGIPAIVVFADPNNWVTTGAQDFQLNTATVQVDGIWYIKKAGLELWSCGTVQGTHYLGIVADNIFSAGTIFLPTNDYSYVSTGNPFRKQGALIQ